MESIVTNDAFSSFLHRKLNSEEQQLFAQSFKMYLAYGNDETKYVVSLDDVWKWLGFSRIDPCKRILTKHFTKDVHYKCLLLNLGDQNDNAAASLLHNLVEQDDNAENSIMNTTKRGGHNKQDIMMTVNTFKSLCMKAATSRSDQIHSYYIKMENTYMEFIHHKLNEMKHNEHNMQRQLNLATEKADTERHRTLAQAHRYDKLVYLMKIKDIDEHKQIVKIGKSTCVNNRLEKLRAEYMCTPLLIEVFVCEHPELFERSMHSHPYVLKYKYTQPIHNDIKSTECYLVNQNELKQIINIMNTSRITTRISNCYA